MVPNRASARRGLPKTAKDALEDGKEIPRPGPTRLVSISQAVGLLQVRASTMRLATSRDRNDDGMLQRTASHEGSVDDDSVQADDFGWLSPTREDWRWRAVARSVPPPFET